MPTPENTFINSVHKHVAARVYREKMCNPYRGGTPDVWYSGDRGDIWIEYKYIRKEDLPKNPETLVVPALSPLQKKWLHDRYQEGRKVFVVVGTQAGCVIFKDLTWEGGIPAVVFQEGMITRAAAAAWIEEQVTYAFEPSRGPS